jgi:hypothetical protein
MLVCAFRMKFNLLAPMLCVTTLTACATLPSANTNRPVFDPKQFVVIGEMGDQHRLRIDSAQCENEVHTRSAEHLSAQIYVYRACLAKRNYRLIN